MTRQPRDRDFLGRRAREPRVTINHEFATVADLIREYVSNISRSGVFIRSDNPLPVGTRVNLCFSVILDELETIEGVGAVVRISESPRGMGVVFTRLDTISQNLIARIMTRADVPDPDDDDEVLQ